MNRDMAPHLRTLFEELQPSVNIFSSINRGVSFAGNKTKLLRALYFLYAHFTGDWSRVDRAATRFLLSSMKALPKFLFVVFPGVDEHSHLSDPFSKRAKNAYADLDQAMGRLVNLLKDLGEYDQTLIVGSSDHGLSQTHTHLELWEEMEKHGYPTLYHPRVFRKHIRAACMVSGNGMANLYFQNGDGWKKPITHDEFVRVGLMKRLLNRDEIDHVITRESKETYIVTSRKGTARIREKNDQIQYQPIESDPFGFDPLPRGMSFDDALDRTYDTDYPDALVQVVQLFRTPRSGDVVVTARPGYDLRNRHEWPEHSASHGSLHKEHMLVPLLANRKMFKKGGIRSADLFPSILKRLEMPVPNYFIDGRSRIEAFTAIR